MPDKDAQPAREKLPESGAKAKVRPSSSKRNGFWYNPWEAVAVALIAVIALMGAAALVVVLLSDGSDGSSGIEGPDVKILTPRDRDTVTRPFVLTVESSTRRIADPAEGIPDSAHFHAFVDIRPFTPSGEVIPEGEGIYHFSNNSLTLDLPPGEHRIIVVLGDNNEVRIPNATVAGITVTVE